MNSQVNTHLLQLRAGSGVFVSVAARVDGTSQAGITRLCALFFTFTLVLMARYTDFSGLFG